MRRSLLVAAAPIALLAPCALFAQQWNGEATRALVARAIVARSAARVDSTLSDYRARAHGFVFFLGQLGEGLAEPPRLVKSDELELEVYWKQPGLSKQRIIGWRDRIDLPTDIQYHRDHLGIVQNNFGNRIRLGAGDEVRDVPHPLSPDGPSLYDFAIEDSLAIRLPERTVRVYEVAVRPKDFGQPRIVGALYIDVATAELVVFRFSFTRPAYLDGTLEDIAIVLENGLWEGRYWLPRRQEIEIRRRTSWLDLPARGIIRGRWEIHDYRFNLGLADSLFRGTEIAVGPKEERDSFPWPESLDAAIRDMTGPLAPVDLEALRAEVGGIAGRHVLAGLRTARPGVNAVSDLLHFNRVEGLAVGAGWVVRPGGGATALRVQGSYGFADRRPKATLVLQREGRLRLGLEAGRAVTDVGDESVIAPVVNSLLAQEAGRDYGDYVLRDHAAFTVRRELGGREAVTLDGGVERTQSVAVRAVPAHGTFRANPPLGGGTIGIARLTLEHRQPALTVQGGAGGAVTLEAGRGDTLRYVRVGAAGRVQVVAGPTDLVLRGWGGWGSAELPPHRAFVMGGRGTLVSEPFRRWGGRYAAYGVLEWRLRAPFVAIPLGPFLSTGNRIVVAPYVAAGWAGGAMAGMPWQPTGKGRGEAGLALEWFHRLVRIQAAVNPEGRWGLTADIGRDLWGIL